MDFVLEFHDDDKSCGHQQGVGRRPECQHRYEQTEDHVDNDGDLEFGLQDDYGLHRVDVQGARSSAQQITLADIGQDERQGEEMLVLREDDEPHDVEHHGQYLSPHEPVQGVLHAEAHDDTCEHEDVDQNGDEEWREHSSLGVDVEHVEGGV